MFPDLVRHGGTLLHNRRAAYPGLIASNDGEDLDAAHVTTLQLPLTRANVGQTAALTSRDDHQLELLRPKRINIARQVPGEVHLCLARMHRHQSVGDGLVGDTREPAQQRYL